MPNRHSWIVCETTGRWAAALRVALERQAATSQYAGTQDQIHELRSLDEFHARATEFPNAIALIETTPDNLPTVLHLAANPDSARIPLIALLSKDLASPLRRAGTTTDILLEAGALAIVTAPRRIAEILPVTRKAFAAIAQATASNPTDNSLEAWAWAQLPWQEA
jgi:hypothetical protein